VPDIEKGVESLIARGLVDADKLGTLGWSNGSLLTIALTVSTTRYKAGLEPAPRGRLAKADWANAYFGASFDNYYFGASPLEDPQRYVRKSPFYKLDRVKTPTIIFFGAMIRPLHRNRVGCNYRALQQLGNTDVDLSFLEKDNSSENFPTKLESSGRVGVLIKYLFGNVKDESKLSSRIHRFPRRFKLKDLKRSGQSIRVKSGHRTKNMIQVSS